MPDLFYYESIEKKYEGLTFMMTSASSFDILPTKKAISGNEMNALTYLAKIEDGKSIQCSE